MTSKCGSLLRESFVRSHRAATLRHFRRAERKSATSHRTCSQASGPRERRTKDVQYARLCRGSRHRSHTSICPCTLSVPDRPLFPSNGTDAHWCFPNKQSMVPNITTVLPECQVSSYGVPSVSLAEYWQPQPSLHKQRS